MTYLSLFEKLRILFDLLLNFKVVLVLVLLLLVLTFIYTIKKISSRKYILLVLLLLLIMFIISIIKNYEILSNTFDNFTTIFFSNIYFPSIYVYIGILTISLIIFITSILNRKRRKIYKIINSSLFIINNILLIILLNIIAKNKIDVFSISSVYTNKSLVAILEISTGLFIVWILVVLVIYLTNSICDKSDKKLVVVNSDLGVKTNRTVLKQNKRLSKKNVKLSRENNILVQSNNKLTEERNILVQSNNKLVKDNNLLVDTNNKLTNENNILVENNNKLTEEKIMLYENNVRIAEENSILIENNNKLTEENNILIQNNIKISEENNILLDSNNKLLEEKNNSVKEVIEESGNSICNDILFNNIINGTLEVTYYDNNISDALEYELTSPQEMYEKNYNKVVEELRKESYIQTANDNVEKDIIKPIFDEMVTVEDMTIKEKEEKTKERLIANTIALNELVKEEISEINDFKELEVELSDEVNVIEAEIKSKEIYTIEDYKQMIKMLNNLKNSSNKSNISIDDAVNISLINNYSIDDCLKFKEILESNLN